MFLWFLDDFYLYKLTLKFDFAVLLALLLLIKREAGAMFTLLHDDICQADVCFWSCCGDEDSAC